MKLLSFIIEKASGSKSPYLKLLNLVFPYLIPFNKSHRFKVREFAAERVAVDIPYRRSNFNHIKGIHACAMATAAEYSAGLLVLQNFSAKKYRLIMGSFNVEFVYQGRQDCQAVCQAELNSKNHQELIRANAEIEEQGVSFISLVVEIKNKEQRLVANATVNWQIKSWGKIA
jgi:acyl-coenzyme A thioesterase PaaI-like protein